MERKSTGTTGSAGRLANECIDAALEMVDRARNPTHERDDLPAMAAKGYAAAALSLTQAAVTLVKASESRHDSRRRS